MRAAERLVWMADIVDPAPNERVLEVGCGHGVLLALLAERAPCGLIVGIDRSPKMLAAAARRNRAAAERGLVRLHAAALSDVDLEPDSFDVVVSFNVRAFWTPPAPEWDVVARVLVPGGRALVGFSVMEPGMAWPVLDAVTRLAAERGLHLALVYRGETSPTPSVAIEVRKFESDWGAAPATAEPATPPPGSPPSG